MTDPVDKSTAKAQKKAAKALAKAKKKAAKQHELEPVAAVEKSAPAEPTGPTPAERSAAAAEQQVVLHRRRFWVTFGGVLVALMSLIVSVLIWQRTGRAPADAPPVPDETPASGEPGANG